MKAIILGASDFPKIPHLACDRFAKSADGIRSYLTSIGLGLKSKMPKSRRKPGGKSKSAVNPRPFDILDLFDLDLQSGDMHREIALFMKITVEENEDLLVFFVGHGVVNDEHYHLLVRSSEDGGLAYTSLVPRGLIEALQLKSRRGRTFFIVDACFAGFLKRDFLDATGVALLAAVGEEREALTFLQKDETENSQGCTVFCEALLDVLKGTEDQKQLFSLFDIFRKVKMRLEQEYVKAGVHDGPLPMIYSKNNDHEHVPVFPRQDSPAPSAAAPSTAQPSRDSRSDEWVSMCEKHLEAMLELLMPK